jgi:glycosyltransferase involved in cell wall biosynthesis
MTKPRVVFVSPGLYPVFSRLPDFEGGAGGAEVQQTEIIRMLTAAGYPVGIITGDFGQKPREEHDGVVVDKLPSLGTRGMKGLRFIHPRLTDYLPLLRAQKPDIIYTRCAGAALAPCAFYARRNGVGLIYSGANDLEFGRGPIPGVSRRDAALFRWGLRRVDAVIVQNAQQQQALRANWGREGMVVPNSYDDDTAGRADFDGPVLLVGTVKPVKRPELFIELARAMPERRFRIIGGDSDGEQGRHYADGIRAAAAALPNVEYVGGVPFARVGREFDGAALLVNTSETEGFPNTFLQAWLRGMPTLSFVAPRDERGATGTQVASDLPDMQRRLRTLLTDRRAWEEAAQLGETQYRRNHTSAAARGKYERLLNEVAAGGARASGVRSLARGGRS